MSKFEELLNTEFSMYWDGIISPSLLLIFQKLSDTLFHNVKFLNNYIKFSEIAEVFI